MQPSTELVFEPVDNERLSNLCGPLDEHLRQLENALDVSIARRGERFRIHGARVARDAAADALQRFYARAERPWTLEDLQLALQEIAADACLPSPPADDGVDLPRLRTRKTNLQARTPRQRSYLSAILSHDVTFGTGPAGTGKTYLAVACAVDALERDQVERIVLTRPAVEAGERLGFLPGDLSQKVDPYLRPLYDALNDLMGFEKAARLFERGLIEVAPLAFMRGRTLNHAFIILDEAQNTTPEQMKMFLTRIGFGARAVVNGDPTQIDLPHGQKSGLLDACDTLASVRGIAFVAFQREDVVRHPLVMRIVEAYDRRAAAGDAHG